MCLAGITIYRRLTSFAAVARALCCRAVLPDIAGTRAHVCTYVYAYMCVDRHTHTYIHSASVRASLVVLLVEGPYGERTVQLRRSPGTRSH